MYGSATNIINDKRAATKKINLIKINSHQMGEWREGGGRTNAKLVRYDNHNLFLSNLNQQPQKIVYK